MAVSVIAALAGCATGSSNGQADSVRDTAASAATRDTVRVLAQTQQSGWDAAGTTIVTEASAFDLAWSMMHSGLSPAPALPVVNFATTAVVFVAAGMRSSGGYAVELGSFRITADSVVVDVVIQEPGANCSVTAALTQPAIAFAIPRTTTTPAVMVRNRVGASC